MNIAIVVNSENITIEHFKQLLKFNFKKYIICVMGTLTNDLIKISKFDNVDLHHNITLGDFLYGVVSNYNERTIYVLDNIDKLLKNISIILSSNKPIVYENNDIQNTFNKDINIHINTNLIEKLFCYNYPDILMNKDIYNIDIMVISNSLIWIKKMFFELRFMTQNYIMNKDEFNFTLNFLINKYLIHYNKT